jgi:hypothetical protein
MDRDTNLRILASQIYICKAQLETISLLIDGILKEETAACKHPQSERQDLTVMCGPDHWKCMVCGAEFLNGVFIDKEGKEIEET